MSFWDDVYELRETGKIPLDWTRADLRDHLQIPHGPYKSNTVMTVPSNQSMTEDGTKVTVPQVTVPRTVWDFR